MALFPNTPNQSDSTNITDVIIVGAGPAGLSFASSIADTGLNIVIVEKNNQEVISNPAYDGREIALTHVSKRIMQDIGMWQRIDPQDIHTLKDASVLDGHSPYQLYFATANVPFGQSVANLGYLISNHLIRKAAYQVAISHPNIDIRYGHGVNKVFNHDHGVRVILDNDDSLEGKLLVVADSRFSTTRRHLGITADSYDFGRSMIVCRMSHTYSNHQRAVECFYYGVTLALLPLSDTITNCVITVKNQDADALMGLSDAQFAKKVQGYANNELGEMTLISSRHIYPLVGVHANRFISTRTAVIGDAAVGMHPVTAHGFNLGLHGVHTLSKQVKKAVRLKQDIGNHESLRRYERQHMLLTRPMYHGTNAMVKLFTTDNKPAKLARTMVLRVSNNLTPLKALITKQLTG